MPLYFCSVACWDSHLSMVRHRDAYAVEARAPSKEAWAEQQANAEPVKPLPQTPDRPPPGAVPMRSVSGPAPTPVAFRSSPSGSTAQVSSNPPPRRIVGESSPASDSAASGGPALSSSYDKDILIVVSKLKKYIKDRSGMNCSDSVADMLSEHVRSVADEAIRAAARDERKTVLDRDVPRARR
jgi:histone H3/H4